MNNVGATDFHDVIFGNTRDSGISYFKLQNAGCSTNTLNTCLQKRYFYQNNQQLLLDDNTLFNAIPIQQQFSWIDYDDSESKENWISASAFGLGVGGTLTDLYLHIKDFETFKEAVKEGKFVANWKGKRVWKLGFNGNASVSSDFVQLERITFLKSYETMRLVKSVSHGAALLGVGISAYDASQKGTKEAWGKFSLDIIMTGVAFIPGPGWVIAGVYFVGDGIAAIDGLDWWHSVWENFILPTQKSIVKASHVFSQMNLNDLLLGNSLSW